MATLPGASPALQCSHSCITFEFACFQLLFPVATQALHITMNEGLSFSTSSPTLSDFFKLNTFTNSLRISGNHVHSHFPFNSLRCTPISSFHSQYFVLDSTRKLLDIINMVKLEETKSKNFKSSNHYLYQ